MEDHQKFNLTAVISMLILVGFLVAVSLWSNPKNLDATTKPDVTQQKFEVAADSDAYTMTRQTAVGNSAPANISAATEGVFYESFDFNTKSADSQELPDYFTDRIAAKSSGRSSTAAATGTTTSSTSSASTGSSSMSSGSGGGGTGAGSAGTSSTSAEKSTPNSNTTAVAYTGGGGRASASRTIVQELRELEPLPKVHYAWGLPSSFLNNREHDLRQEYARITHSLTTNGAARAIHGRARAVNRIDNLVYACAKINRTDPEIPVSIAVSYSPWHRKFMPDVRHVNDLDISIFQDPSYQEEIDEFISQMTFTKQQIAASNRKYGSNVKVSALLMNAERFSPRRHDPDWNKAMARALDDIHKEAIKLFPDARIEWYSRGMGGYTIESLSKWYSYFTGKETYIPTLSYTHYGVPDPDFMQERFLQTCELADTLDVKEVTPWLGLAWGRKRDPNGRVWFDAWDYDVKYSYYAGKKLNELGKTERPEDYPPYHRVGVVVIYTPFASNIPEFGKHFIEYCKGAAAANR